MSLICLLVSSEKYQYFMAYRFRVLVDRLKNRFKIHPKQVTDLKVCELVKRLMEAKKLIMHNLLFFMLK